MNNSKLKILISCFCLGCQVLIAECPPRKAVNRAYRPAKSIYCRGENINTIFTTVNQILNLISAHSGVQISCTTATNVFHINSIRGTAQLVVKEIIKGVLGQPSAMCNFTVIGTLLFINVSQLIVVDAGSDNRTLFPSFTRKKYL